ncbi:hypothetical protein F4777DRAFT_261940 [Nemania sp. FL0916]|nr:hypothetical protein F4777DRAFT_261940 [Nemania sp. FL0916]
MVPHYPLCGVDLDFRRYAPRPVEGRDILISRIMDGLLHPQSVSPRTYLKASPRPPSFVPIKAQDRQLGLDLQVMWRLLELGRPLKLNITIQQAIMELVQAHYFERDPPIHKAIISVVSRESDRHTKWKHDMLDHLALFGKASLVQHRYSVFSGNGKLSCDAVPHGSQLSWDPFFIAMAHLAWWLHDKTLPGYLEGLIAIRSGALTSREFDFPHHHHHHAPKRSQSLPPDGCWGIIGSTSTKRNAYYYRGRSTTTWALFPLKPLSELDKRSRRRSLSQTHIRAMFTKKTPERAAVHDAGSSRAARRKHQHPCENCAQHTHATADCKAECGWCSSGEHKARNCPMKRENRCKCRPFPQFHRASECAAVCSRKCGSRHPPGTFKHKNAMLCAERCCMCGVRGHSGKKCALRRCPCGGQHLTQDCRWKVECAAPGCDFYLCHIHCRECGRKREKGPENAFVGRTCQTCLGNAASVSARAS